MAHCYRTYGCLTVHRMGTVRTVRAGLIVVLLVFALPVVLLLPAYAAGGPPAELSHLPEPSRPPLPSIEPARTVRTVPMRCTVRHPYVR